MTAWAVLGVPALAGTDVTGPIPWEVAPPAGLGLDPRDAVVADGTRLR